MTFLWVLIAALLALVGLCEIWTWRTGVPTVTSTPAMRRKMIEILKSEAEKADRPLKIVDLGSGTGKLALQIGKALPESQITGLELSPVPFLLSLLRRAFWRAPNVAFKRQDFWTFDTSGLDAVVLYMNGAIRQRMAEKLKEELHTGALVISNETHLPGWEPIETHQTGLLKLALVVYRQNTLHKFSLDRARKHPLSPLAGEKAKS